jgi:hypothetical protein
MDRPQVIPIQIWTTDALGNTSNIATKLTIYTPIPEITTIKNGQVNGTIGEPLASEIIDIVRFRNGQITPLSQSTLTTGSGSFTLSGSTLSGVTILSSGKEIARINETSGVMSITGSGITTRVLPATEKSPLQIQLISNGSVLYRQSFALPKNTGIVGESSGEIKEPYMRVTPESGYTLVRNGPNAASLQSGAYITRSDRKAIAGISPDGNIYLLENTSRLQYRVENMKVVIDILDSSGRIASVEYSINAEYVAK